MKKIAVAMLFVVSFAFSSERVSMAVYDLSANQVEKTLADAVADFIQAGLHEAGRFNIIERKNVKKVLTEQQFQKTGCSTTECAVEVGRILNVNNIITGSVSKTGARFVIMIQLIDVEAAKVILTDKVECDSEDLLNTASSELTKHFSRGVSVRGKVLKVINDNEMIVGLGLQDNIVKGQELNIERLGETVKDDAGRVVYQEKKLIAVVKPTEIMEEASKVSAVSKNDKVVIGDIIELKREKLTPLSPILKGPSASYEQPQMLPQRAVYGQPTVHQGDLGEGFFGLYASIEGASDFRGVDTNSSNTTLSSVKLGTLAPNWTFEFVGGGPILQNKMKWLLDIEGGGGIKLITLRYLSGNNWTNYDFLLMPIKLGLRFYPFAPLLNADYAKFETASEQRGWFSPYAGINGNLYIGLFEADSRDTYGKPVLLVAGGADARFGIEFFNVLFAEFIWRFLGSVSAKWDWHNSYGSKIGSTQYTFDLVTTGIGFGLRARF
jgi:TolB-like protein